MFCSTGLWSGVSPECLPSLGNEQRLGGLGFLFSHLIGFPRTKVSSQLTWLPLFFLWVTLRKKKIVLIPPTWPDVILPLFSTAPWSTRRRFRLCKAWKVTVEGVVLCHRARRPFDFLLFEYYKAPPAELPGFNSLFCISPLLRRPHAATAATSEAKE